jgi:MinD superfamily P-loop ATPase
VRDVDYVLLVTEPTPFGLNDLKLSCEMLRKLGRPFGVVVNRSDVGNGEVRDFCRETQTPLLLEIPFKRQFAHLYAEGALIAKKDAWYYDKMKSLYASIIAEVEAGERVSRS